MKIKTSELTLIALFTALTAALSQISINLPITPVPFTMQLIAVFLSGAVGGKKVGFLSQIVYILLGVVGIPVFAGFRAGPVVLLGPGGGYIAAFPLAALVCATMLKNQKEPSVLILSSSMFAGLACIYAIGAVWLSVSQSISILTALITGVAVFIPLDIAKTLFAGYVSQKILYRVQTHSE